ncbi:hypothetical protein PQX77_022170 [Marasmius sp. AFHP31]|nr:hypothetical protein PQX77_022170 [Marasmius sp. AFHP31]
MSYTPPVVYPRHPIYQGGAVALEGCKLDSAYGFVVDMFKPQRNHLKSTVSPRLLEYNLPPDTMVTRNHGHTPSDLGYKLPLDVENIKKSWELALQSGAVVTALLASLSAGILQIYRSEGGFNEDSNGFKVLEITSYGSLLCNASATCSSLLLMKKLQEISLKANPQRGVSVKEISMFWLPTVPPSLAGWFHHLRWYYIHWNLAMWFGFQFLFWQVSAYVGWSSNSKTVRDVIFVILLLATLPILWGDLLAPVVNRWVNRRQGSNAT